ncbi:TetR/AcrR family transcriptional regulator [Actinotalea sp. M2MS4P-6]|uniref:TetR/AcrR family transcriptional regulator n=1 Tax=Actinotalea sp. M2MS4P-6 TaxID=2983762 RepID=UPI0021E44054|nr:TetR/AcrR family transcriptional regulator [Actinotalea sp. M2MS4P-6]MCV2394722.1 TetR/AcrR family transcriptional regulator [Actinotalea sp. M2MS4P-6]
MARPDQAVDEAPTFVVGRPARDGGQSPVARRILDVATPLFYGQGIRAVSADVIIEAAEVTKATFYRHFPTKDHLVTSYLLAIVEGERAAVSQWRAQYPDEPGRVLLAYARALIAEVSSPSFRGCPFVNATAEYPDLSNAVRSAVGLHRAWLRDTAAELLAELGVREPQAVAVALIMLRDGAMVAGDGATGWGVSEALLRAGHTLVRVGLDPVVTD